MKTYSGELKDGMMCRCGDSSRSGAHSGAYYYEYESNRLSPPQYVYIFNKETGEGEWQLYKPQADKVWGIPESGENYWVIQQHNGKSFVQPFCNIGLEPIKNVWLSQKHAEQHAKAENYINKFRALSDVPVDGVRQWFINSDGLVTYYTCLGIKLKSAVFGVVVDDGRVHELEEWREKMRVSYKIAQFGFHGIVEEVL